MIGKNVINGNNCNLAPRFELIKAIRRNAIGDFDIFFEIVDKINKKFIFLWRVVKIEKIVQGSQKWRCLVGLSADNKRRDYLLKVGNCNLPVNFECVSSEISSGKVDKVAQK